MADQTAKRELYEQFAEVGKALGNGRRLELLNLLTQGERSVEALATAAGLALTTASSHLQALRRAGLVAIRRDGTRVHYTLAGDDVAQLFVQLRAVAHAHMPATEPTRRRYLDLDDSGDIPHVESDVLRDGAQHDLVVDVRPAHEFTQSHIPGAVSIPLDELPGRVGELPTDRRVIVYCRGRYCAMAHDAVRLLTSHGIDAARLTDGVLEWRLAGLPLSRGQAA